MCYEIRNCNKECWNLSLHSSESITNTKCQLVMTCYIISLPNLWVVINWAVHFEKFAFSVWIKVKIKYWKTLIKIIKKVYYYYYYLLLFEQENGMRFFYICAHSGGSGEGYLLRIGNL